MLQDYLALRHCCFQYVYHHTILKMVLFILKFWALNFPDLETRDCCLFLIKFLSGSL